MVKKRELKVKQKDVEMQESSDSSSEEEQRHPPQTEEASDSSSDEEQEQEQEQPMEVEESDGSSEEEQQPVEVEGDESSSEEEEQKMEVDESEADEQEAESEAEEEEVESEEEENEKSESEEIHEEEQEQSSSSETEEEKPKPEMKKRKPSKVLTPTEAVEPKKKKVKTTNKLEQAKEAGEESFSIRAVRALSKAELQDMLIAAAKKHEDVLAQLKASSSEQRKVFVGGLSQTTTSKGLRNALSAFGEVADAFVLMDKLTGNSRGFGFVTFAKVEAAQRAAEKKTLEIDGRKVECKSTSDTESSQKDHSDPDLAQRKLFVGGLSQTTTSRRLRKAFLPFGEVADAFVVTDKFTGSSRGFGFVTFVEAEAARCAAEKTTLEIDGNRVECKSTSDHDQNRNDHSDPDLAQRKVFVVGLSSITSPEELKKSFSVFGEVEKADVPKDKFTGNSRGFGFVTFVETEAAQRAAKKKTLKIDGNRFECRCASDPDIAQRKVFVSGLSSTLSTKELKKSLSAAGKVEDVFINRDAITGKSRRCGFVTFVEAEAAQRALKKKTLEIDGRTLVFTKAKDGHVNPLSTDAEKEKRKLRVVYDMGLKNPQVGLRTMFETYGSVESVDNVYARETGKSKGIAFITFKRKTDAGRALEKPTKPMPNGSIVICRPWNPEPESQADPEEEERKVKWRMRTVVENPENAIYKCFKDFGEVELIDAIRGSDGKASHGFITFAEKSGAENALKEPVKELDSGNVVKCEPMKKPAALPKKKAPETERQILVRFDMETSGRRRYILKKMSPFGKVEKMTIQYEAKSKDAPPKAASGFAVVTFCDKPSVGLALEKPTKKFKAAKIFVCFPNNERGMAAVQRSLKKTTPKATKATSSSE